MAVALPGSNCRKEMDKVVTRGLVSRGFQFIRGPVTRQCHYTCCKTDASLLHDGNDIRIRALDKHLDFLQSDEGLGKYLDVKNGGIETSDTKLLTQDSFFTHPDPEHRATCWHGIGCTNATLQG